MDPLEKGEATRDEPPAAKPLVHAQLPEVADALLAAVEEQPSHGAARDANDLSLARGTRHEDLMVVACYKAARGEIRFASERQPDSPRHGLSCDERPNALVVGGRGEIEDDGAHTAAGVSMSDAS